MSLSEEINKMRKEIRTDAYPMSIGELTSIYVDGELDIHPEFQRFYRWNDEQKSNLIESILLGIPIPPIFVSQHDDGTWDVVDGLQRLSTIFQLQGVLRNEEDGLEEPLVLRKTKYLSSLGGKMWKADRKENMLSNSEKLLIKRAKIDISIVLRESDSLAKFELFQRLNTGGSSLTFQEVRNCMMVMLEKDIFTWLKNLANHESFLECIALSDEQIAKQAHLDLAWRFVVFYNLNFSKISMVDINEFLNEKVEKIAEYQPKKLNGIKAIFKKTFDILYEDTGGACFRKYYAKEKRFKGGFIISAYEAIALGIGYNIKHKHNLPKNIKKTIKLIHKNDEFQNKSGAGAKANSRLPAVAQIGREYFNEDSDIN